MDEGPVGLVRACGPINSEGKPVTPQEFAGVAVVGLYHTASWCPPCRVFTPVLAEFAAKHPRFRVVVLTGDRNEHDFRNYIAKYPEFLAVPFDSPARSAVLSAMQSTMMPNLHIYSCRTGELLTTWGRTVVNENPEAMDMWLRGDSGVMHGKVIGKYLFVASALILLSIFIAQNLLPKHHY
eukprot:TRINITY_DN4392_c0_g1_i1.p1 TRINITY_DN4392_c0_g1~~TRINITY_DN4392_c0_g1_i1.p1  ORF type:complete len:181 (+),score=43.00 TRINITY_DN4392_c0_g1_i1:167-709(+)